LGVLKRRITETRKSLQPRRKGYGGRINKTQPTKVKRKLIG